MPRLERGDGVEIHWEQRGEGPLVVLVSYWSMHPSAFEPLTDELCRDHRVVRYDERGSGRSTRRGPYDLETASADLEAVVEAAGGRAVAVSLADGTNRAVRVAARRPDLIERVVSIGTAPIGMGAIADSQAIAASRTVVGALTHQMQADYRGAIRGLLQQANEQMTDDEVRARVQAQVDYTPGEVALERMRAYGVDEPSGHGRELGGRLCVVMIETVAGGWLPGGDEMVRITAEMFPEARVERIDQGIVTNPGQTAAIVREVMAARAP